MTPERKARLDQVLSCRQSDFTVVTDYIHKGRKLVGDILSIFARSITASPPRYYWVRRRMVSA
ncbi:MAG: hypothetical protein ACI89D_002316 [Bermanella sp.]|jgi:hypothetical protein